MARTHDAIDDRLAQWLAAQPVFFVATAPVSGDGSVNCSPKGNRGEFAVVSDRVVAYLDQTGSGIETIAHLRENGRIVVMFCAFSGPPRIVRLHGTARPVFAGDGHFGDLAPLFGEAEGVGVRSIIEVEVRRVADSCGYGVPLMSFTGHRPTMDQWSARQGREGVATYWTEKNATSIDDLEGMPGCEAPGQPDEPRGSRDDTRGPCRG